MGFLLWRIARYTAAKGNKMKSDNGQKALKGWGGKLFRGDETGLYA